MLLCGDLYSDLSVAILLTYNPYLFCDDALGTFKIH